MRFAKYHALGNDYLVFEETDWPGLDPSVVRRVCDRHLGIGSDGVLLRAASRNGEAHCLRIFNPDGSEAEKSGNGLRIFARYLWDHGVVGDQSFAVSTAGGDVRCLVHEGGQSVSVDMGRASFHSASIPVTRPPREVLRETLSAGGRTIEFSAVTIGNPHCVILSERARAADAKLLGPLVESDPRFPNRTNVQLLEVLDRANLKIEIWERGAGYTLASGSSSCAAAAVARRLALCEAAVTVHMPGGQLAIEVDEEFSVRMTGAVVRVAEGRASADALEGA